MKNIRIALTISDKKYPDGFGYAHIDDTSVFVDGKKRKSYGFYRYEDIPENPHNTDGNLIHRHRLHENIFMMFVGRNNIKMAQNWTICTDQDMMFIMDRCDGRALLYSALDRTITQCTIQRSGGAIIIQTFGRSMQFLERSDEL